MLWTSVFLSVVEIVGYDKIYNEMRLSIIITSAVLGMMSTACGESSAIKEQLWILSKQVKTLLDRRKEDLSIIEDNIMKKMFGTPNEFSDVREDIQKLR